MCRPLANGRPPLTRRLKRDAYAVEKRDEDDVNEGHRPSTVNQNSRFHISMMSGTVLPFITGAGRYAVDARLRRSQSRVLEGPKGPASGRGNFRRGPDWAALQFKLGHQGP
jgi:hypothetical protein